MKLLTKFLPIVLIVFPLSAAALSLSSDTSVQANTTVGATTSAGGSIKTDVSGSGNVDSGAGVKSPAQIQVTGSGDADVAVTVGITGDPDFDLLVETVKTENERVQAVDVDADGAVDVAYRHDGRFLGVIPVKVTSHTVVKSNEDGTVSVAVRLPWWSFLVSGVSKVRSDIEAALTANAEIEARASANASAESRVRIVEAIVSSLNAQADAQAAVEAGGDAKVSY